MASLDNAAGRAAVRPLLTCPRRALVGESLILAQALWRNLPQMPPGEHEFAENAWRIVLRVIWVVRHAAGIPFDFQVRFEARRAGPAFGRGNRDWWLSAGAAPFQPAGRAARRGAGCGDADGRAHGSRGTRRYARGSQGAPRGRRGARPGPHQGA